MTNDRIKISRRKVLAGLGTVGLASAGAGLGTSAFFSDREDFQNNTLTAGEFDLKVDWQQSYFRGLPGQDPDDHATWQKVNAYPDVGTYNETSDTFEPGTPDNIQDPLLSRDAIAIDEYEKLYADLTDAERDVVETRYRNQYADMPDDFQDAVIDLPDVKPGDKGEITISFHLFDNPGYLWMGGELVENAENSVNEPESKDPDEDQTQEYSPSEWEAFLNGEPDMMGELADEITAQLWYDDNCNNRFDQGREPCVQFVVDATDSMDDLGFGAESAEAPSKQQKLGEHIRALAQSLASGDTLPFAIGLTSFGQVNGSLVGTDIAPTTSLSTLEAAIDAYEAETLNQGGAGDSILNAGIDAAAAQLATCPAETFRTMVVITNGINTGTVDPVANASNHLRSNGSGTVDMYHTMSIVGDSFTRSTLANIAALTAGQYFDSRRSAWIDDAFGNPEPALFGLDNTGDNTTTFDTTFAALLSPSIGSDTMIAQGTLKQVLEDIAVPTGVPLDADRDSEGRDCYPASTTHCVALRWELPVDHANEIQSDSVTFALRFYGEQCRHNDGTTTTDPFGVAPQAG